MKQLKLLIACLLLTTTVFSQSVKLKWKQIQTGTEGQVAIVGVDGLGAWVIPPFLNLSDTSAMLAAYQTQINARVKYTDTSAMLAAYITALNGKMNFTDTSAMLSAYRTAINLKANDNAVVHLTGAETVAGVKTFSSSPVVPTPTSGTDAANKDYVDALGTTAAATYIPLSQKAANNGVATLDGSGKIPNSQIPALAISETYVVSSVTAMYALSVEVGDVAIRTDSNITFILQTDGATIYSHWKQVLTPAAPVQSVNGQTGNVSLTTTNISEGTNLYYTDTRSRLSISAGSGISYNNSTGVVTNSNPHVATNIGQGTLTTTTIPLTSSTGTGTTLPSATTSLAGLMSSADKTKLNGIATGATANTGTVTSVAMTVPTGLSITGTPVTTSGTLAVTLTSGYSIPTTANQTNWTDGYNNQIVSAAVTGTTSKTATLTQQDGGTVTFSWTDLGDVYTDEAVDATGSTSNTITLPHAPTSARHLIASLNGVELSGSDWGVTGTTVTLSNITRETTDHLFFYYSY